MLCGNLSQVDDGPLTSRSSSHRRSRRKEKNPYANRGLDQFKMVLADLQARKEKIMAQVGASDPFLVRFVHENLRDWVPIIIKLREPKQQKLDAVIGDNQPPQRSLVAVQKSPVGSSATKEVAAPTHSEGVPDGRMKKRFSWDVKNNLMVMDRRRPSNYWPVVMILILLCLVMFGRSFAIMCTSICWYLVPTNRVGNVNLRRSMNKKYGRRLSEKNLAGDGRYLQSKMSHSKTFT